MYDGVCIRDMLMYLNFICMQTLLLICGHTKYMKCVIDFQNVVMDRSLMQQSRLSEEYVEGVKSF